MKIVFIYSYLLMLIFFSCKSEKPNHFISNEALIVGTRKEKIPAYYSKINFSDTKNLFYNLSKLITETHTNQLSYTPEVWEALKKTDLDPRNKSNVLLVYGSNKETEDAQNSLSRGKEKSRNTPFPWNREHVYPKSKGMPNLGTEGPGADIHMLRPCDKRMNEKRGNLPYEEAAGEEARKIRNSWYPGNRWKGDVARIMMYMYLRYGERANPKRVAISKYTYGSTMPDLFLKWNVQDPVDNFERNRNEVCYIIQGNRNPFIDNPYLAYVLWKGPKPFKVW